MCYYTKVHFNIIPTIHKKYRKQNKEPKRKITTGRGVVLAKKQFSSTVSFSASNKAKCDPFQKDLKDL
jgi:hypothetical protein